MAVVAFRHCASPDAAWSQCSPPRGPRKTRPGSAVYVTFSPPERQFDCGLRRPLLPLASDAPVVVTGAMRNPSLAGEDGPANILTAIRVAASDRARGLGALVVMNDQIHAARWVQKAHTASTAAFTSPGQGPLGQVTDGRVDIPARLRQRSPVFRAVSPRDVRVGLVTITLGDDGVLIDAIGEHVDGLVVAALGAGHVPADTVTALAKLAARMPVVLASRTGAGPVHHQT